MTEIKVEIGRTGFETSLFIDGSRVFGVQTLDIHAGVGERTKVLVTRLEPGPSGTAEGSVDDENVTIVEVPRERIGSATTGALLREVAARMDATQNSTRGRELGSLCREAIERLDKGVLNYRTIAVESSDDAPEVVAP